MIKLEKLGYFTASEAIKFLGIPRTKFYILKREGKLPKPVMSQKGITIWNKADIVDGKIYIKSL